MPDNLLITLLLIGLLVNMVIGWLNLQRTAQKGRTPDRQSDGGAELEKKIAQVIHDYFLHSGVEVKVSCTQLTGSQRYTALIESEPMKRFRLSHIIESTLAELVKKTCQRDLEKVYWRFPVKAALLQGLEASAGTVTAEVPLSKASPPVLPAGAGAGDKTEPVDTYINEGLENFKHLPKLEATELSWEKFQEASLPKNTKKTKSEVPS